MSPNQYDDFQEWATTGGGEGDPAAPTDDIRDYVENIIGAVGNLVFATDDIPDSATSRSRGAFTDYNDLVRYLDGGGLTVQDEMGNYIPNPIVFILGYEDPFDDDIWIYEVWIDDDTN